MAKLVWWFIRGLIYSAVIFALMYFFIYLKVIPNLWEGTTGIFTINTMIALSIVCGLFFSAVITFITGNNRNKIKR